jgi:hypothetical protein
MDDNSTVLPQKHVNLVTRNSSPSVPSSPEGPIQERKLYTNFVYKGIQEQDRAR